MAGRFKSSWRLAVCVVVAGLVAAVSLRAGIAALLAAAMAALSSLAWASAGGAGKGAAAAGAGLHVPALAGALGGAVLQWRRTVGRSTPERVMLSVASLLAAYFGGLLVASAWPGLGAGAVGLGGMVAANLAIPVIDGLLVLWADALAALRALLADVPWLKRLVGARVGLSTETVDKPVDNAGPPQ